MSTVYKPRKTLGVGCGDIGKLEIKYVNDALKKKRLSYGYYLKSFEEKFAELHDRKFAIFLNSGTSALLVSIQSLKELNGWNDNDEIIVPALTFVATINTVLQNNLKPVFVDVDPIHFDIDTDQLESKITNRTRAIMPVNILGQSCQIDNVIKIAKKHNLKIIEDSCESMFINYKGKPVGSRSDIACFSTYIAHLIVTGVGGIVTTNNPRIAVNVRSLEEIVEKRFNFVSIGHSLRATELEGAIGLAQLSRWKKIIRAHQKNASYLTKRLSPLSKYLQLPSVRNDAEHAFMAYPIVIRDKKISRDKFTYFLETRNIETRFLLPLLNQPAYKKLFGKKIEDKFPIAKYISRNGFYIGCHQELTKNDMDYIVDSFFDYFKKNKQ
jgi:dTDP-4-amino-4,6-dideoxygalactose transaminase